MESSRFTIIVRGLSVLLLGLSFAVPSKADDSAELLKPTGGKTATSQPAHHITYKLSGGSDKWDADTKARIVKAMDEATAIYNKYGDFDRVLTANLNPGTPTADANFGGWINFGGQIGTRTALHEIAHTLGIGTCPKWGQFSVGGKWIGKYGIAQLKEFDGPDAVLHCDRQHFWPYGLNYDNEGGKENFKRNVMMVTAMRADMGLGPPPHPAAMALRAARDEADSAHVELTKAQDQLKVISTKFNAGLDAQPEVVQAEKNLKDARAEETGATARAMDALHQNSEYHALEISSAQATEQLDDLRGNPNAKPEEIANASQQALNQKTELSKMQSKALAADQDVVAAKSKYVAAATGLDTVKAAAVQNNPDIVKAKTALDAAKQRATKADQAVTVAEKAATAELEADVVKTK